MDRKSKIVLGIMAFFIEISPDKVAVLAVSPLIGIGVWLVVREIGKVIEGRRWIRCKLDRQFHAGDTITGTILIFGILILNAGGFVGVGHIITSTIYILAALVSHFFVHFSPIPEIVAGRKIRGKYFSSEEKSFQKQPSQAVKSMYRELVKRYHPDYVLDEKEKERRGEILKIINRAYENGDKRTLLLYLRIRS